MRAHSRFYRILLKLLVMGATTGSQGYSILHVGFACRGPKVRLGRVYTHQWVACQWVTNFCVSCLQLSFPLHLVSCENDLFVLVSGQSREMVLCSVCLECQGFQYQNATPPGYQDIQYCSEMISYALGPARRFVSWIMDNNVWLHLGDFPLLIYFHR